MSSTPYELKCSFSRISAEYKIHWFNITFIISSRSRHCRIVNGFYPIKFSALLVVCRIKHNTISSVNNFISIEASSWIFQPGISRHPVGMLFYEWKLHLSIQFCLPVNIPGIEPKIFRVRNEDLHKYKIIMPIVFYSKYIF